MYQWTTSAWACRSRRSSKTGRRCRAKRTAGCSTPTAAAPDDVCLLVDTSGTTGQPTGVQHTHTTLLAELRTRLTGGATDSIILAAFPSGHVAGTLGLFRMLLQGVPHVVMDTWDAITAARLINEHGARSRASFRPRTRRFRVRGMSLDLRPASRRDVGRRPTLEP
uniref:AMP-binding protein n=1 Tax=Mycobacterium sp. HUMS_1102779 TaxID=3383487 RepID=UPI00389AF3CA